MRSIQKLRLRLRSIFLRPKIESELDDEIRFALIRDESKTMNAASMASYIQRAGRRKWIQWLR